jgi:hypothetical protein
MFEPRNRYLLIIAEALDKEKEESSILLPEDYKPDESMHTLVTVLAYAPDCNIDRSPSHRAVVSKNMIEEVEVGGEKYKLILENYVLGFFKKK